MKAKKKPAASRGARKRVAAHSIAKKRIVRTTSGTIKLWESELKMLMEKDAEAALEHYYTYDDSREIWRSYMNFMVYKLPVPAKIQAEILRFVMALVVAENGNSALRAIGRKFDARKSAKSIEMFKQVESLMRFHKLKVGLAAAERDNNWVFERAAKVYGLKPGSIRTTYYAHIRKLKSKKVAAPKLKSNNSWQSGLMMI